MMGVVRLVYPAAVGYASAFLAVQAIQQGYGVLEATVAAGAGLLLGATVVPAWADIQQDPGWMDALRLAGLLLFGALVFLVNVRW